MLAQDETEDERWGEVRWLLRLGVANVECNLGYYAESADRLEILLTELDEDRIRPWPYTGGAKTYWRILGYYVLGFDFLFLGRYEEAQRLAERSLALAEKSGSQWLRIMGIEGLVRVLIYRDDCRRAEKHAHELLRIARTHRDRVQAARGLWILAQALAGQGSYARAR